MRIKAGLVDPPERFKIGLLKLSDAKPHAAIVAGEWQAAHFFAANANEWSTRHFFLFSPPCAVASIRSRISAKRHRGAFHSHRRGRGADPLRPLVCLVCPLQPASSGRRAAVGPRGMPRKRPHHGPTMAGQQFTAEGYPESFLALV